jgi:hypothetical protein
MIRTNLLLGDPRIIHDAENEKLESTKNVKNHMKIKEDENRYWWNGGAQPEKRFCPNPYGNMTNLCHVEAQKP